MTIDDLEELIGTIETELGASSHTVYRCMGGQLIGTDVGYVEEWFNKYKHVLKRRYGYEIVGEKR